LIDATQRKLREAQFFHNLLDQESRRPNRTDEAFRFYLSAFISAARSISWVLKKEETEKYLAWNPQWEAQLNPEERKLLKLTNKLRVDEVHRSGASTIVEWEEIAIGEFMGAEFDHAGYQYGMRSSASPGTLGFPAPPKAKRAAYYLQDDQTKTKVTVKCEEYLAYLKKMVEAFLAAHPEPTDERDG